VIYLPIFYDNHPDHYRYNLILRRAVAAGSVGRGTVLRAFEVWSALVGVNACVDISSVIDVKLEALCCHKVALDAQDYTAGVKG